MKIVPSFCLIKLQTHSFDLPEQLVINRITFKLKESENFSFAVCFSNDFIHVHFIKLEFFHFINDSLI